MPYHGKYVNPTQEVKGHSHAIAKPYLYTTVAVSYSRGLLSYLLLWPSWAKVDHKISLLSRLLLVRLLGKKKTEQVFPAFIIFTSLFQRLLHQESQRCLKGSNLKVVK